MDIQKVKEQLKEMVKESGMSAEEFSMTIMEAMAEITLDEVMENEGVEGIGNAINRSLATIAELIRNERS